MVTLTSSIFVVVENFTSGTFMGKTEWVRLTETVVCCVSSICVYIEI